MSYKRYFFMIGLVALSGQAAFGMGRERINAPIPWREGNPISRANFVRGYVRRANEGDCPVQLQRGLVLDNRLGNVVLGMLNSDSELDRIFQESVQEGRENLVEFFLANGADVTFAGNAGLLDVAVGVERVAIVRMLLEHGATPTHRMNYYANELERTALDARGRRDCLLAVINHMTEQLRRDIEAQRQAIGNQRMRCNLEDCCIVTQK